MSESFLTLAKVPAKELANRLETVRELRADGAELYELAKDRDTGEHFLHYAYLHRDIAGGGAEETYHQLLPLESDDVLSVLFGEQPYTYPDYWTRAYLRNGPEGFYVWFDPLNPGDEAEAELLGRNIRLKLERFKEGGDFDENAVRKLLEELDRGE